MEIFEIVKLRRKVIDYDVAEGRTRCSNCPINEVEIGDNQTCSELFVQMFRNQCTIIKVKPKR